MTALTLPFALGWCWALAGLMGGLGLGVWFGLWYTKKVFRREHDAALAEVRRRTLPPAIPLDPNAVGMTMEMSNGEVFVFTNKDLADYHNRRIS